VTHSESIAAIATALAKAQAEITPAIKDSENPFYHAKYADLASVWDACRAALTKHGLAVIQTPRTSCSDGVTLVTVGTMLAHTSGEWVAEELSAIPTKDDPQGIGSCITYLRRYSLSSFVGVAPEDDDAEGAVNHSAKPTQRTKPAPKPTDPSVQAGVLIKTIEACDSCKALVKTLDSLKHIFPDGTPETVKAAGKQQLEALALLTAAKGVKLDVLEKFIQATRYLDDDRRQIVLDEITAKKDSVAMAT
jgi:hypothetical protein